MSKTKKHKHNIDDVYGNDEVVEVKRINRSKQKRFDRALRTKNIDELMALEDEHDDIYADDILNYQVESDL